MNRLACAVFAAAISLSLAAPAFAHAHPHGSTPAAGSTVTGAPATLECVFTEALEPAFSSLQVQDAAGKQVDGYDMHLAPADAKRMQVGLPKLGAGTYTVIWRARSVDGHETEGRYNFTVAP
jgi:methionine-rich copper-binding protein CopC